MLALYVCTLIETCVVTQECKGFNQGSQKHAFTHWKWTIEHGLPRVMWMQFDSEKDSEEYVNF